MDVGFIKDPSFRQRVASMGWDELSRLVRGPHRVVGERGGGEPRGSPGCPEGCARCGRSRRDRRLDHWAAR